MTWTHTGYAQRLRFGRGVVREVGGMLRDVGGRRAFLITTERGLASPDGQRLRRDLGGLLASVFDGVRSHVPTGVVEAALRQARRDGIDSVVSFGGGSCADLGKAVCFFVEQEAGTPGASYFDRPAVPHLAIPTTYSGAELTPFFGMTDEAAGRKRGGGGPTIAPVAAVYDPELTLGLPPRQSAETGMNALAHCIEASWSPVRTPEAEAVASAGVERIASSLVEVFDHPDDVDARTEMLVGAALGGRCLQNASMGVHHGLAQLVGGRTGIPHGLANAVILAHAIRFNAEVVPDVVARIAERMGAPGEHAADAVDRLRSRLGLPGRLSECGVTEEDVDAVARMASSSPNVAANPRPVSEADARSILEAAF